MSSALTITEFHKSTFLYQVAQLYAKTYGTEVSKMWFIFPNRRNGLFFQQFLSSFFDKPIFAPRIFTINELFSEFSNLTKADSVEMLFELYKVYIKKTGKDETFDEFWNWGETLLGDFDDIDTYQVDARQLFSNLKDIKDLDDDFSYLSDEQKSAIKRFWASFDNNDKASYETSFISIWEQLYDIYVLFREELKKQGKGYTGMICQEAVDYFNTNGIENLKADKVVFIGLNALNTSEITLLKQLDTLGKADFYWDFFSDEIRDPGNKAGLFLQRNVLLFPSKLALPSYPKNYPEVTVYSVPSHTGLTRQAGWLLKEVIPEAEANSIETAVVLTDEQLLMPMVHQLPDVVKELNITMGYPIINSPVYGFIRTLLDLQNTISVSHGESVFFHKHVLSLLSHNYLKMAMPEEALDYSKQINRENKIVVEASFFANTPLTSLIFQTIEKSTDFISYLLSILQEVAKFLQPKTETEEDTPVGEMEIEREFIYHVFIALTHFGELLENQGVAIQRDTMMLLLRKLLEGIAIPFSGEPMKGLQILGVLETRTMDFKNLIILPMNEGIFPHAGTANTVIPYNLRKGFGLPTIEDQDAIYAYYFYRLLQRSQKVHLLYNSKSDGIVGGEQSRFIYQMKYLYPFDIKEKIQKLDIKLRPVKEILITKGESEIEALNAFTQKGEKQLSVSALNDYLDCSLKFYFKHIKKLREEEELTDSIDAKTFGTIFHFALETVYLPMEEKLVTKEWLTNKLDDKNYIPSIIKEAFGKEYFKKEADKVELKGKYIIIADILNTYISKALEHDRDFAPFLYIKGEYLFNSVIEVSPELSVNFKGYIDRIDQQNNFIRIIDYKTGSDELKFSSLDSLFSRVTKRPKAVFQTLAYCMMYKDIDNRLPLLPAVYKIQEFFKNFDPYIKYTPKEKEKKDETIDDIMPQYRERFSALLAEIFNPDFPFEQTKEQDNCNYCAFKGICCR